MSSNQGKPQQSADNSYASVAQHVIEHPENVVYSMEVVSDKNMQPAIEHYHKDSGKQQNGDSMMKTTAIRFLKGGISGFASGTILQPL